MQAFGCVRQEHGEFVSLIGTAAVSLPTWAKAQQSTLTVGFLSGGSRGAPGAPDLDGLRQGLAEGGYYEGRNLAIEYRWADGQFARLPALSDDVISRHVALIATATLPAALAAKAAKPITPVIFVIGEDPISAGLVNSLNRPGSNATGVSDFINELAAKRLELVRQTIPDVAVIGLLVNPDNPNAETDTKATETAAHRFGQKLFVAKAANDGEVEAAFAALANERVGALCVNIDPFLFRAQKQIISLAGPAWFANDLSITRVRPSGRAHELQPQSIKFMAAGWPICRASSTRRESRRSSSSTGDQG